MFIRAVVLVAVVVLVFLVLSRPAMRVSRTIARWLAESVEDDERDPLPPPPAPKSEPTPIRRRKRART